MGFEPTTASLEGWNSTTELRPPALLHLPALQHHTREALIRCTHSLTSSRTGDHKYTCGLYPVAKNNSIGSGSSKLGLVGRQGFEPWKT